MLATRSPRVGDQAPEFQLDTPSGEKLSLEDLNARRTLIIFQRHLG